MCRNVKRHRKRGRRALPKIYRALLLRTSWLVIFYGLYSLFGAVGLSNSASRHCASIPDVCVFSAFSTDRLSAVAELRRNWPGEISVATAISDKESRETLTRLRALSGDICANVSVLSIQATPESVSSRFPVNRLRNIAKRKCAAKYIMMLDIDFTIFPTLDAAKLARIERMFSSTANPTAIVIPAFGIKFQTNDLMNEVKSKAGLMRLILRGAVAPFNMEHLPSEVAGMSDHNGFYPGHLPTDYHRWLHTEVPYLVHAHGDQFPYYYEPYFIIENNISLGFDESFVYYGFNKVSFVHELAAIGYQFMVQPELFTVHMYQHPNAMQISPEQLRVTCSEDEKASFYKASIGHSCIAYFLKRLECAYGFSIDSLSYSALRSREHVLGLIKSSVNVPCFPSCVYDLEPELSLPSIVHVNSNGKHVEHYLYEPTTRAPCAKMVELFQNEKSSYE